MKTPEWVTNEASWIKTCKKVVARASDLEEDRISVINCAREMSKLAFWLREQDDKNFIVFRGINSESDTLPTGKEREHWSEDALKREDKEILRVEAEWKNEALLAAQSLRIKYEKILQSIT